MKQAVQIHLQPSRGDMLIFMPGQEEIEVTCDSITGKCKDRERAVNKDFPKNSLLKIPCFTQSAILKGEARQVCLRAKLESKT